MQVRVFSQFGNCTSLNTHKRSLNTDTDKLAFSCTWKSNAKGEVLEEPWFGKSVIRSRMQLSYEDAQVRCSPPNFYPDSSQLFSSCQDTLTCESELEND